MALFANIFAKLREISGVRGEMSAPYYLARRETITAAVTTNLYSTFLTDDGLSGGRKLFAGVPFLIHIGIVKDKAGANAAITDYVSASPGKYTVATAALDWWCEKIATTTPTIMGNGDGAIEFNLFVFGESAG